MGLVALIALLAYIGAALVVASAAIVSAVRLRAIPLFWILAVIAAAAIPFVINEPMPKKGNMDHAAFSFFLEGAFTRFNLVCVVGALVSCVMSYLPIGLFRISSAMSWGFASALAVRLYLLFLS